MIRAFAKNWWLLALCGILDAAQAAANLLMLNPHGALGWRRFALPGGVRDMGMLALAAGACAIAAALGNPGKNRGRLLALHGLALAAFGLIGVSSLVRGTLSFRPVSLLFVLMAVSLGALAWDSAPRRWFARAAGAVSMAFALSFLAVGFGGLTLPGPRAYWIWMSSYFAFCALLLLWQAVESPAPAAPGTGGALPPIGHPRPAH